jgi:hypothetical protein
MNKVYLKKDCKANCGVNATERFIGARLEAIKEIHDEKRNGAKYNSMEK